MSGKASDKEIEKRKKTEKEERFKRGVETAKQEKENHIDKERNEELAEQIKALFSEADQDTKDKVKVVAKEYGMKNFNSPSEFPTVAFEKIIEILS